MDDAFESFTPLRKAIKRVLIDPLANYLPASLWRWVLATAKSELAAANWTEPGGWRSMVISYDGRPHQWADKVLVGSGAVSMALRNRLRLASRLLGELIDSLPAPVHLLCLGAGPGLITVRALAAASTPCDATLVDLNPEGFEFGRELARRHGLEDRMRFIQGDVRDVGRMLEHRPSLVKMIGICEYLTDEQIVGIASAVAQVMPPVAPIVFNNITRRHGNDRFLRRVFGLHMVYRSVKHMTDLMRQAGFGEFHVHQEPLGVYSVIVGRRTS